MPYDIVFAVFSHKHVQDAPQKPYVHLGPLGECPFLYVNYLFELLFGGSRCFSQVIWPRVYIALYLFEVFLKMPVQCQYAPISLLNLL